MGRTDQPYEVAARTLFERLTGLEWDTHPECGRVDWRDAARRCVKAFHAERKRLHEGSR